MPNPESIDLYAFSGLKRRFCQPSPSAAEGLGTRNLVRAIQLMKVRILVWEDVEALLPYIDIKKGTV